MKMYYFKGSPPNFGDELNQWLWPRLLPGFFDECDDRIFLGIGSILFDFYPSAARKIVFGAGYGGYTAPPIMDDTWEVYFVRGPITAQTIGVDKALGIGDAAILLRSCIESMPLKRFKTSFMPHWESVNNGDWATVCADAGLHLISPCASVGTVIDEIQASEVIIAEAMHGAIVADALRVPWIPVRPIQVQHRKKWLDWASALQLDLQPRALSPSNGLEAIMSCLAQDNRSAARFSRHGQFLKSVAIPYFHEKAVRSLQALASAQATLSRDAVIERAHQAMLEHLDVLNRRNRKVV